MFLLHDSSGIDRAGIFSTRPVLRTAFVGGLAPCWGRGRGEAPALRITSHRVPDLTVAEGAFAATRFAVANWKGGSHVGGAFQASSPKTFRAGLRAGLFFGRLPRLREGVPLRRGCRAPPREGVSSILRTG